MHIQRASSFLRRIKSDPQPSQYTGQRKISSSFLTNKDLKSLLLYVPDSTKQIDLGEEYDRPLNWKTDFFFFQNILRQKINILLIFFPFGILSDYLKWSDLSTFWLNFISLIPLAGLLGNATEEVAFHTNDVIGGLLNATLGNAVEMIITVQALNAGTLLGSILCNILLVLGMAFFFGGLFNHVQKFNAKGATCSASLLLLACLAFITPTVISIDNISGENILTISRLSALIISLTYCLFLFFQLYTHFSLFVDDIFDSNKDNIANIEYPALSLKAALALLVTTTLLIFVSSECLIKSISGVCQKSHMTENFIGIILLPLIGNAAEHSTAISVAIKNKPDLSLGVAVGSSTQVAMFMVPFAVIVSWVMNIPMTLVFSKVSITILAISILIVIGIIQDGESNWLEGVMLIAAYSITSIVYWFDTSLM